MNDMDSICPLCQPHSYHSWNICEQCKLIQGSTNRRNFFGKILQTIQQRAQYLRNNTKQLNECKDLWTSMDKIINNIRLSFTPSNEYIETHHVIYQISQEYMKDQTRFDDLVPVRTEEDGNCLFHSIITLGRLNNISIVELRARSLLQVIINYEQYLARYGYLDFENKTASTLLEYCSAMKPKDQSEIWDVIGLCDVLKCKIKLMCYKDPAFYQCQDTTYIPLVDSTNDTKEIIILWTTTSTKEKISSEGGVLPYPNHFVPLLRKTSNKTISTDQTITSNSHLSYSKLKSFCLAPGYLTNQELRSTINGVFEEHVHEPLRELSLAYNWIDESAAEYLSTILKSNQTLTVVNLSTNCLGARGVYHLCEALKTNKTLLTLDVSDNDIRKQGAQYVRDALGQNQTLTTLILDWNHIGDEGAQYLSEALELNQTLRTLKMSNNKIKVDGARFLSKSLEKNKMLVCLDMSLNAIQNEGVKHFSQSLEKNETLQQLHLDLNDIDQQAVEYLKPVLQRNKTLHTISMSYHEVGAEAVRCLTEFFKKKHQMTTHANQSHDQDQEKILLECCLS